MVNIAPYAKITLEICDSWGNPIEVSPEEIELVHDDVKTDNTPDHWQDVRERAAIAAMQCIIKELYGEGNYTLEEEKVARYSVCYADALVKKLKGE